VDAAVLYMWIVRFLLPKRLFAVLYVLVILELVGTFGRCRALHAGALYMLVALDLAELLLAAAVLTGPCI